MKLQSPSSNYPYPSLTKQCKCWQTFFLINLSFLSLLSRATAGKPKSGGNKCSHSSPHKWLYHNLSFIAAMLPNYTGYKCYLDNLDIYTCQSPHASSQPSIFSVHFPFSWNILHYVYKIKISTLGVSFLSNLPKPEKATYYIFMKFSEISTLHNLLLFLTIQYWMQNSWQINWHSLWDYKCKKKNLVHLWLNVP